MTDVPSNLVPTRITQLPEYQGSETTGYMPYVYGGITYKVQFSNIASVGAVPSSRIIAAGTGLTGGGDLSQDRVISVLAGGIGSTQLDATGVVAGTYGTASSVPQFYVNAKGRIDSVTEVPIVLSGYVPDSRTVIAGTGLTGGGALSSNVTLNVNFSSATPEPLGSATAGIGTQAAREDHVHPAVDLASATEVQGVLPLNNGGTGNSLSPIAGAVVYSTDEKFALTNSGSAGQVLISAGGASAPVWTSVSTLVGPTGPTGAASTVVGPTGATGPTGAASTVAGPTGPTGAASTVAGPTGPTGAAGPNAVTANSTTTSGFAAGQIVLSDGSLVQATGAGILTSSSAAALTVGRQGATNPVLNVDASTASVVTGLNLKGAAAAGGMALSVISSGANENLTVDAKGSGTITLGGTSTGAIIHTRASTFSAAITYGGVTLSNAVTGTGNMVLSTSPTLVTPVLGTPASGTATNLTGLPISSGVSGLGTGIATALAVNTGSAGAPVLFDGAGGTPSSMTATNLTGTASGLTAGTASAVAVGGITGLGTGVATALGVNTGSAGAFVVNGGALGTPSSGTVTNLTGTASININGTVGATTASTGAFTTTTATTSVSSGVASTTQGSLVLHNTSANSTTLQSSNSASAAYTITLPVAAGTNGQVLTTDGTGVTSWATASGTPITSTSANAFAVGRQGNTDPVLNVDASTASVVTGLNLKGAAAAGGMALSVTSSGANENLTINAKGSGTITLNNTATGGITLSRATTMSAALTYGGVTLSNSVTGTGSMALSASPTFTGTVTTAELTTTGIKTAVGTATGTAGVWYNTSLTVGSQAPCVWILTACQPSGVSVGSWMITTENGNGNGYVFPMSTGGGMECQMSGTTAQVRGLLIP
jgi:hypothetical protein